MSVYMRICTKQGCNRKTFMDSDRCFDHQQTSVAFKAWFTLVLIFNLALIAFAVWVVIQLVTWVTSK